MRTLVALVVLGACGGVSGGDNAPGDDTTSVDSNVTTPPLVAETVTCSKVQTLTQRMNADNSRTETKTAFATFNMAPTDRFVVEFCDQQTPTTPACPSGYTCTTTGDAMPPASNTCFVTTDGTFANGQLVINCGTEVTSYNGAGALLGTTTYRYGTIRLHR